MSTGPRSLAGKWREPGKRLYLGSTSVARAENAGESVRTRGVFGKRTACTWTTLGRESVYGLLALDAGPGCSGTPISPSSTALTTAGTACRPAFWRRRCCCSPTTRSATPRRRPGPTLTSGGKWRWGLSAEDRPFAKSTLQVFRAQLILHDKVLEVFESSLRLARESGCLNRARDAGGIGHDQHPGTGRGQGHLQSIGRRDRQIVAGAGGGGASSGQGMGPRPGI